MPGKAKKLDDIELLDISILKELVKKVAVISDRREVVQMSTYEALLLILTFGLFLVALLAYLDNRNNKRK